MQYCMYLRKSRADAEAEARGDGETLARHRKTLYALAERAGITVSQVYEEIVSGDTIASRPAVQELLNDVNAGKWDGVLCMEVERLARGDTIDQGIVAQSFKFSSTKIITPTKTYDPSNEFDEEYFEFSLFMSRREYKTINRRMQAGRLASIKDGNYIGSLPPYGYRKVRDYENGVFTLEPIPEEAEYVRMVYIWYTSERIGAARIATRLNDMGVKPKRADAWSPSSISDMLHNPVYIGKNRWNWRKQQKHVENGRIIISRPKNKDSDYNVYDAVHPAIVEVEIWDAAQSRAPLKRYNGTFDRPQQNPFVGLMYCSSCGHAMSRQPGKYGAAIICKHSGCACVGSKQDRLERVLYDMIVDEYNAIMLQGEDKMPAVDHTPEVSLLEKELQKCDAQNDKLCELLETGIYTTEMFLDRSEKLKKKRASVSSQIEQLRAASEQLIGRSEAALLLRDVIDGYYHAACAADQNAMLRSIIYRIDYSKTTRARWKCGEDLSLDVHFRF